MLKYTYSEIGISYVNQHGFSSACTWYPCTVNVKLGHLEDRGSSSSETLIHVHRPMQRHILEGGNILCYMVSCSNMVLVCCKCSVNWFLSSRGVVLRNTVPVCAMKTWRSGGVTALILNLGTRWRWIVSFTSQLLHLQGNTPSTNWIAGWVDPTARNWTTFPQSFGP